MSEENDKLQARKARYLRDPLSIRLGNLASNLSRLKSFARHPAMEDAARKVLRESEHFIEWTAADVAPDIQPELIELQRLLAKWQEGLDDLWSDSERRSTLATHADDWSKRILEHSGLLAT